MNKACIFDFDGVMIDSERLWEDENAKKRIYRDVYGEEISAKLHNKTLGLNMDAIHKLAVSYGSTVSIRSFYDACDKEAKRIYTQAPITEGLDILIEKLVLSGFSLGIVSASPKLWIDIALSRLEAQHVFGTIISLHDRPDLAHKPAPDGYIEAMKLLQADPHSTIIIEDSNTGIQSARASGAYTIGLRQNLVKGYAITGADAYADTIREVPNLI